MVRTETRGEWAESIGKRDGMGEGETGGEKERGEGRRREGRGEGERGEEEMGEK